MMEMNEIQTSSWSRLLVFFVVISITFVILLVFFKYFIKKDFDLYVKETCDPALQKCFVHQCEDGDVRCSSLPDGKYFYKIILQKEYNAPVCNSGICPEITCSLGDTSCKVYLCSDDNLKKFELSDKCSI